MTITALAPVRGEPPAAAAAAPLAVVEAGAGVGLLAQESAATRLPCQQVPADWFFPDTPEQVQRAKQLCAQCPVAAQCLATAQAQSEPWGVWGGQLFQAGQVIAFKRPRGRPRKDALAA